MNEAEDSERPSFKVPHTYVILFCLLILASLASYVIPGGEYRRVEKQVDVGGSIMTKRVVESGSFQWVESAPQNPWRMIRAIMKGLKHRDAVTIIFFILLIGGAFGIVSGTRAIEAALAHVAPGMDIFEPRPVAQMESRHRIGQGFGGS